MLGLLCRYRRQPPYSTVRRARACFRKSARGIAIRNWNRRPYYRSYAYRPYAYRPYGYYRPYSYYGYGYPYYRRPGISLWFGF